LKLMPDSYVHENGTADHALFANQKHWMWEGYGILNGCTPTPGSGDWEVDVASGDALVGGASVSVSATTKTLTAPSSNPRWDVLYVDSNGAINVVEGTEQPPDTDSNDNRLTRLQTRFPVPDDLSGSACAVIAIVWVDPQLGPSLSSDDVIDRRIDARTPIDTRNLSDDAITAAKIAASAVGSEAIDSGAVGSDEISSDAVTAAKIAASAVNSEQIATDAVGVDELASALGTDSNNKIPGTTYLKNADVESLNASDSVTANGTGYIGTFATENDLPDPANHDVGDEATVINDPNNETSKYTLVDE